MLAAVAGASQFCMQSILGGNPQCQLIPRWEFGLTSAPNLLGSRRAGVQEYARGHFG
jgi:hypothetical protein